MVRHRSANHRPHDATFVIIDGNDQLARYPAVTERHDTGAGLETRVGYESRHQPGVERANVAHRVPNVVRPCFGENFLAYRCHFALRISVAVSVARMERSAIRDRPFPDYASLHPGYK